MPSHFQLKEIFKDIDQYNSFDPNHEFYQGREFPREQLYGVRMTEKLNEFHPEAPIPVQIAARGQHVGRWEIPRQSYPMNKVGYFQWRNELKVYHSKILENILIKHNADNDLIERVKYLIQKKNLKNDPDTQTLEDVICLVFLEYYLEEFAGKHPDEKVIDILTKTWRKMSEKAHEAALKINYNEKLMPLIERFVGTLHNERNK